MDALLFCPQCHNLLSVTCNDFATGELVHRCAVCQTSTPVHDYSNIRVPLAQSAPGSVHGTSQPAQNSMLLLNHNPYLIHDHTLPIEWKSCNHCQSQRQCIKIMVDQARLKFEYRCTACQQIVSAPTA